ncbi:MAG TPA: Ig-like domain-containing protein, partial [Candidatus Nitrosopolaris sp.]|nr:Ig-like domain-containing protein [Candidatus Nitrosopolaris sp.]
RKLSEGLRLMIEPPEKQPPPSQTTEITAAHMTYDAGAHTFTANGNPVVIRYGTNEITASQMTYNASAHTLTANGPVVIRYGAADHSTNFGPVIERFLPASSRPPYNESNYLDLDSGSLLSLGQAQPPVDPFNVEQFYDWRQASGADVVAQIIDDSTNVPNRLKVNFRGLVGLNTVLLPVDKSAWDNMSPEAVIAAVEPVKPDSTRWTMATTLTNGLPATHLFKTSEGGMGILQILGFTDNPPGVEMRYKLVQSGSAAAEGDLTLAEQPPVVVETFPVSGARDVAPGETEIRVRFSKPMSDGSWSWSTAWENSTPASVGPPHYLADQRTCVMPVRLEPGRTYAWWLNSDKFKNFADQAGQPAVPYLLIFRTKRN